VEGEVVTDQAKQFLATGKNPYQGNSEAVKKGYTIFSTACSGCHGHLAEGKLGPALADSYWTYPKNETDKGLFETIYGGAAGMMGPQQGLLKVDEILHVMAWIRFQGEENAKGGSAAH
jgi:cytochrome c-L